MALQKREKILLSLAGAAVLIFVITNILPKLSKDKPATTPSASTRMTETRTKRTTPAVPQMQQPKLKSYTTRSAWNLEWKNDPFVYAEIVPDVEEEEPEEEDSEKTTEEKAGYRFELNGISWLNNRPTVLINDRIMTPGESIEGYILTDVKPTHVILTKNNERIRLTFSEGAFIPGLIPR
jgi:hypothetical protein